MKMSEKPNHRRKKGLCIHVSRETRKTLKLGRSITARKGDTVKVVRGGNRGKSGSIIEVDAKRGIIYVEGITRTNSRTKKEVKVAIRPSNVILVSRGDLKAIAKKPKKEKKEEPKEEAAKEEKNEEPKKERRQPGKEKATA